MVYGDVERKEVYRKEETAVICPRCGGPMNSGICDNCGFPMRRVMKTLTPWSVKNIYKLIVNTRMFGK